jgi:hypothetical protein
MSPKKDKGPSTENLSSLRAVLEASLAGKNETQTPVPKAEGPAPKREFQKPAGTPAHAPKPQSLLEEIPEKTQPKEISEEVLKGLLSD